MRSYEKRCCKLIHYQYTEKEMKTLLKSLTIVTDTREQRNEHVRQYLMDKGVPFVIRTMKTGDYSAFIPKNTELGITRDIYLDSCLERKNGVDELVESIKDRQRFENELIRASKSPFVMVVEDGQGYEKILLGKYRSQYKPESLLGSLKSFEARYNFTTVFLDKKLTGNYIYHHFYYQAKEYLKRGAF